MSDVVEKKYDPFIPSGYDPRMPMWELWEVDSFGEFLNLVEVSSTPIECEDPTEVVIRRWWVPASGVHEVRHV